MLQRRLKKQAQSLQCVCACGDESLENPSPPGRCDGSGSGSGSADADAAGDGTGEGWAEGDRECCCPTQKSFPSSPTAKSKSDDALLAASRLLQLEALEQQLQIQREAAATWQAEALHQRNMNAAWKRQVEHGESAIKRLEEECARERETATALFEEAHRFADLCRGLRREVEGLEREVKEARGAEHEAAEVRSEAGRVAEQVSAVEEYDGQPGDEKLTARLAFRPVGNSDA